MADGVTTEIDPINIDRITALELERDTILAAQKVTGPVLSDARTILMNARGMVDEMECMQKQRTDRVEAIAREISHWQKQSSDKSEEDEGLSS